MVLVCFHQLAILFRRRLGDSKRDAIGGQTDRKGSDLRTAEFVPSSLYDSGNSDMTYLQVLLHPQTTEADRGKLCLSRLSYRFQFRGTFLESSDETETLGYNGFLNSEVYIFSGSEEPGHAKKVLEELRPLGNRRCQSPSPPTRQRRMAMMCTEIGSLYDFVSQANNLIYSLSPGAVCVCVCK